MVIEEELSQFRGECVEKNIVNNLLNYTREKNIVYIATLIRANTYARSSVLVYNFS